MKDKFDNKKQAEQVAALAIGHILRLGSRSEQEGDIKSYENARWAAMDAFDYLGIKVEGSEHSYIIDRKKDCFTKD